jgi:large subunit ribosomal protein L32
MSVPGKRLSRSKGRRRRSQQHTKKTALAICMQCGKAVMPHRVCTNCGYYNGREVMKISLSKKNSVKKTNS